MVSISEQAATAAAGAQRGHACELHDTLVTDEYYKPGYEKEDLMQLLA